MIRGSDDLDYEDLTDRLLGVPARTAHNVATLQARRLGKPVQWVKAYVDVYDAYKDHGIAFHAADTLAP